MSLNSPMQMVGNLVTGFLMDRFGRKLTIQLSSSVVRTTTFLLLLLLLLLATRR